MSERLAWTSSCPPDLVLEAAVDAELFDRHSRGVTLTAAGEALHPHAQRILQTSISWRPNSPT